VPGHGAKGDKKGPRGFNWRVVSALSPSQPVSPQKRPQKGLDYPCPEANLGENQTRSKSKSPSFAEPKNQILINKNFGISKDDLIAGWACLDKTDREIGGYVSCF
jgi:hypothetical protein